MSAEFFSSARKKPGIERRVSIQELEYQRRSTIETGFFVQFSETIEFLTFRPDVFVAYLNLECCIAPEIWNFEVKGVFIGPEIVPLHSILVQMRRFDFCIK